MPQSLSAIYIHVVFSTKHRQPFLTEHDLRLRTHAYIGGILSNLGCIPVSIGGVQDHLHVLTSLARTETVAKVTGTIKSRSSAFVKEIGGPSAFEWQSGYGAFSVDRLGIPAECRYIENQEEHHRKVSFQEEYRRILTELGIEFDERYVWD